MLILRGLLRPFVNTPWNSPGELLLDLGPAHRSKCPTIDADVQAPTVVRGSGSMIVTVHDEPGIEITGDSSLGR